MIASLVTPIAHNFNSIKVRLEHDAQAKDALSHVFQFHKGTIRTEATQAKVITKPISIP